MRIEFNDAQLSIWDCPKCSYKFQPSVEYRVEVDPPFDALPMMVMGPIGEAPPTRPEEPDRTVTDEYIEVTCQRCHARAEMAVHIVHDDIRLTKDVESVVSSA